MLILITKGGRIGNAIMYGGEVACYTPTLGTVESDAPTNLYYVETDYGNHMKLTWQEITEQFEIGPVRSYEEWKRNRSVLLKSANLIEDREQKHGG